ncbi:MAG TPA: NAD-dependent succinate-semialdehyde dehydrogenase [Gammaproteobacteria bacterium]|nr:NAD-dependent succinate-semialdehyde dehydrogenase [Gammaproteobacteria bacterium]
MLDVINPATGKVIRQLQWCDESSLEQKLKNAALAYPAWRALSFAERAEHLRRVAATLRESSQQHSALMTEEMGKPVLEARGEVEKSASGCEHYADFAQQYLAPQDIPSDAKRSWVQFLPLGTVLGILPWNSPYWLATRVFAPALMAGNTVILKHDSHVPGCAAALEQAFADAGVPKGVFQTVMADHSDTEKMIRDPRISAVSFTGSTGAGSKVAAIAASAIKPAVLELGGSDPAIVLADADLDKAVDVLTTSRFICAGQSCIAAKRLLIEESIYAEFVEKFSTRLAQLKVGDPTEEDTDIGPIARADLRDALHDQVTRSIAAGAKCLMGGKLPKGPGSFYPVTLLTDVPLDAAAFTEETFGPVAAVRAVEDVEEAFAIANDTVYGLGASIWTQSERGAQLAARFESGQVAINGIVKSDPRLPSGGIKRSGYGKELGPHGIREFVNAQQVWQGE